MWSTKSFSSFWTEHFGHRRDAIVLSFFKTSNIKFMTACAEYVCQFSHYSVTYPHNAYSVSTILYLNTFYAYTHNIRYICIFNIMFIKVCSAVLCCCRNKTSIYIGKGGGRLFFAHQKLSPLKFIVVSLECSTTYNLLVASDTVYMRKKPTHVMIWM